MLVAYRLAGLSALEAYYAGGRARAQFGPKAALLCRKGGDTARVSQFRRRIVLLGILILLRNVPAHEGPL